MLYNFSKSPQGAVQSFLTRVFLPYFFSTVGFSYNINDSRLNLLTLASTWRSLRPPQLLAASVNVPISGMAQSAMDAMALVRRGPNHWNRLPYVYGR